jgi:hypothetical protein
MGKYDNSLYQALKDLHPEHKWEFWRFKAVPKNYWRSLEHQRDYFEALRSKYQIDGLDGWYSVDPSNLIRSERS